MNDTDFMRRCLELAERGGRAVMPNPMVGAVIVHNNVIIAQGWHQSFGGPHAEIVALRNVQDSSLLSSSTLYVSLEPCSHFGKTPPCADAIVAAGIPKVVIGCRDPFEKVAGEGIRKLRDAGIDVTVKVLETECASLNRRFIVSTRFKRPYVILKWAATADGFIAREDYSSKWISNEKSRALVHEWRAQEMAIMVGTTTARVDNPQLTVRSTKGVNPTRVFIDKGLTVSRSSHLFDGSVPTIAYTCPGPHSSNLKDTGVVIVPLDLSGSLSPVLEDLYRRSLTSLIVEGGATLLRAFIEQDLWDEAREFIGLTTFGEGVPAPKLPFDPQTSIQVDTDSLRMYEHPQLSRRYTSEDCK